MPTKDSFDPTQLLTQLAGVSVVALGGTAPEHRLNPGDWGWSPAYQDALDLRLKYEALVADMKLTGYLQPRNPEYVCCRVPGCGRRDNLIQFWVWTGPVTEVTDFCCENPEHRDYVHRAHKLGLARTG